MDPAYFRDIAVLFANDTIAGTRALRLTCTAFADIPYPTETHIPATWTCKNTSWHRGEYSIIFFEPDGLVTTGYMRVQSEHHQVIYPAMFINGRLLVDIVGASSNPTKDNTCEYPIARKICGWFTASIFFSVPRPRENATKRTQAGEITEYSCAITGASVLVWNYRIVVVVGGIADTDASERHELRVNIGDGDTAVLLFNGILYFGPSSMIRIAARLLGVTAYCA